MIRILHLSDIQYGRHHVDECGRPPLYDGENYSIQLTKLTEDLEFLKESEKIIPNFVAVTGDIAESSSENEYKAADEFLKGLANFLNIDRSLKKKIPGSCGFAFQPPTEGRPSVPAKKQRECNCFRKAPGCHISYQ